LAAGVLATRKTYTEPKKFLPLSEAPTPRTLSAYLEVMAIPRVRTHYTSRVNTNRKHFKSNLFQKQLQERRQNFSKCNVFESPLWHHGSSSTSLALLSFTTSEAAPKTAARPRKALLLPTPAAGAVRVSAAAAAAAGAERSAAAAEEVAASAEIAATAASSSLQVDAQSLPWMCALPRCLAALPRVCALLRSQSDVIWRLICDLSEVLNAPPCNNEEKKKKRKRCTESDAESDAAGDQKGDMKKKKKKKNKEGGVNHGEEAEEEEDDNEDGEYGHVVGDISEQETLSFEKRKSDTSSSSSCCWGEHAATLIDAATAAAGMKETLFRHQDLTVVGKATEVKHEENTDQLLASSWREEPLVLQRYAVYTARKKETPIRVAKTLGLPLVDVLRWNQKK
jgi:hypothetical protein